MDEKQTLCCENVVHHDAVKQARSKLPSDENLYALADFFKTFADSTRIKIIFALMQTELCVCDLSHVIQTSQSAVSHQLRLLRQGKLVKFRKVGKTVYYSLDDEHIHTVIKQGLTHIMHKQNEGN